MRTKLRLNEAAITIIRELWHSQPKQLRALWGNVNGERMWYALHGYDLHALPCAVSPAQWGFSAVGYFDKISCGG